MNFSEEEIVQRLEKAFKSNKPPETPYTITWTDDPPSHAAVLMPFLCTDNGWRLLFIRRTQHPKDRHGGQVAYPGGRCDAADPDAYKAALREAHEEVGLKPEHVRILGKLRDMVTVTNYQVTPIVGTFPWPYDLRPQPDEVSHIFSIPLEWLADPKNRQTQYRKFMDQGDPLPVIYFKHYDGELLWGASARMTMLLLEALGLSDPEDRYK